MTTGAVITAPSITKFRSLGAIVYGCALPSGHASFAMKGFADVKIQRLATSLWVIPLALRPAQVTAKVKSEARRRQLTGVKDG